MKKTIISTTLALLVSFAQGANQTATDSSKAAFYSAFDALKNMLDGKDSLNFEKAVFITENAYYDNVFSYQEFKQILDFHSGIIKGLAESAKKESQEKYKTLKLYEQKMFNLNTTNWAIFKYMTDTTTILENDFIYYKPPFNYSSADPYGTGKWENTQILHLLTDDQPQGNCYALTALFKIFSDRLKSDARLAITPHHIYIQNRNQRGDFKNVELATKTFPGDGSIQVLTYTTKTSIMNGMAQRPLSDRDAVAMNLIYLAKGFEHKFNDNTNDFLIKCADLAFKCDTLSLNALLLKTEITENKLFQTMKENKIATVTQARANPKTQKLFTSYEKQLSNLYKCGYREIPKDIQHIILSAIQGNKDGYITTDKTPNPFASIGQTTRYATLSGGLFDEMHYPVDTIQYFHASLNTKKKKIIDFLSIDTTPTYKVDPVVFALSVDPLAAKYPGISPYAFVANNPIIAIDPDGRDIYIVTKDGAVRAGKSTLLRTPTGKEIWNKYANSKTHDVYITSQEWTKNTGMAAGTLNHAEKNLVKDNKIDIGTNADFNSLEGLDVSKSEGRQISLISVNEKFSDKNSKYGNAKTLFHEVAAHVDNPDASEQEGHEKVGIMGYEPAKDKPGYFKEKVKAGSTMDKFNTEMKQVIKEDKTKQSNTKENEK